MLLNYQICNYVLRKTKSFNKSRYSRNRQYYRTGVFLCLWANIILVMGAYYLFFRLTFKFNYMFILLIASFMLVLFSYFSRNFTIGLIKSAVRLVTHISFNFIIFLNLLIIKAKVLVMPHALVLLRSIILKLKSKVNFSL